MHLEDRILFIDGDAIVIDKPHGLPVDYPRAGGPSIEGRIEELMLGFKRPPVPMHRLDQDTSGCLLFARNPRARAEIQKSFEAGLVEKSYLAVLGGEIEGDEGMIDLALGKVSSAEAGWRMVGDADGKLGGKSARTRWRKLDVREGKTLVAVPAADRPYPPDPRPCARGAGHRHRRRPRLRLSRRRDAAPRLAAGGAARVQADHRCHRTAARTLRRMGSWKHRR